MLLPIVEKGPEPGRFNKNPHLLRIFVCTANLSGEVYLGI
jgi:hypothetical protein